jgi:O-antigen/teichoic acid export membrane protein
MAGLWARLKHRNVLLVVDTAIAAGMNVILLLAAARSMTGNELSDFSLVQLMSMTMVMLQRAFFLSPALSAQRTGGRAVIPKRWVLTISLPMALLGGLLVGLTVGISDQDFLRWTSLGILCGGVVLAQDSLRFCLLSRNAVHAAVVSDAVWLSLIVVVAIASGLFVTADSLALYWGLSGVAALVAALIWLLRRRRDELPTADLGRTWRLGKWSGIDALMSATANLLPMLLSALVLGSEFAGTYRVLQSALGPLNILSASLLTMFGLDSWRFASVIGLRRLARKVRRSIGLMVLFAFSYVAVAEIIIISISGLQSSELFRIAIIVGIVGVLGAATSPVNAASLAMGYQKHGAILRAVIVTFSLAASLGAGLGLPLPWNDPIGVVTLFAAAAGLVGWGISYRRALEKERRLAREALRDEARPMEQTS